MRSRCNNFTANEMEVLLTLVESHKEIIECKKTDAVTNGQKENEWEKITVKFNAAVGTGRTSKNLRNKWDAWKKSTKKEFSAQKNCLYKTGGGPYTDIKLGNWGDRVLGIIGMSATGSENMFDSDNFGGGINNGEADLHLESTIDLSNADVVFDDEVPEIADKENTAPSAQVEEERQEEPQGSTENSKVSDWKQWSPALLRTKIHSALTQKGADEEKIEVQSPSTSRGASVGTPLKRKRKTENATGTVTHGLLLERKLELVNLQINLMKKEHEDRENRNKEKHELEMAVLRKQLRCTCEDQK